MCGVLFVQRLFSGQFASRNFLVRPAEPAPSLLVSSPSRSIYVGKTESLRVPFFWNPSKLVNPHLCVVGITGSGKSYFVKTFITRASLTLGAGALILDWAGEYSDWVRTCGGRVVKFGDDGINLLDLGGATPHARTRQVMESLDILTDISSFPRQRRLTEEAIEQCYLEKGFRLHEAPAGKNDVGRRRSEGCNRAGRGRRGGESKARGKKTPTLEDAWALLQRHSKRNPDSAEAAHRIRSLILSSGKSFCASTIRLEELLGGMVCVDLHSLPMESLRSLAGLAILQFVKEKMRKEEYAAAGGIKLFVVCDEAWKIAADARSDVVSIVREGRKYGFGLIVASQNPTDVHRSIFSNAGTVMAFRLTLASEREYIRSSLSYSDHFESRSHSMAVGQALVHIEPSGSVPCPKTFMLKKVDGEELLVSLRIMGDGMDLEFERSELQRRLLAFGLSDRQASSALLEFERRSNTLSASQLATILGRFGHSRASIVSLLRELGAGERGILSALSAPAARDAGSFVLSLEENARKAGRGKRKK